MEERESEEYELLFRAKVSLGEEGAAYKGPQNMTIAANFCHPGVARTSSGRCSGLARSSSGKCSGAEWKLASFTAPLGVRSEAAPAWPEIALGGTPGQSWKPGSFTALPGVQPGAAPGPAPGAAENHMQSGFDLLGSN
jgi:hypothetical protein